MVIEGRNAIIEALRADVPLSRVLIAEGARPDRALIEIERRASEQGVRVERVRKRTLDELSERGAHQGVLAQAAPFAYTSVGTLIERASGREQALIIALDHVTDPGNLGAVARTAEVVGAVGLLVPERRSAAITPAAWKAAAGALAHIPVARVTNLVRALDELKQEAFWVAGASERAEQTVWRAPLEGRLVLVMGSEGTGLSRLTSERCDFLVRLPQAGEVGSLNVAQATTALAYEWLRRTNGGADS